MPAGFLSKKMLTSWWTGKQAPPPFKPPGTMVNGRAIGHLFGMFLNVIEQPAGIHVFQREHHRRRLKYAGVRLAGFVIASGQIGHVAIPCAVNIDFCPNNNLSALAKKKDPANFASACPNRLFDKLVDGEASSPRHGHD